MTWYLHFSKEAIISKKHFTSKQHCFDMISVPRYRFYIYRNGHVRGYPVAGRLGRHRRVRGRTSAAAGAGTVIPPQGSRCTGIGQTLQCSFSAVSKQTFASKYALELGCI